MDFLKMGQRWHSCKIPACFNSQAPMEGCMRKGNCAKSPCEYTKLKKKQSPFVCIKTMKNIPDYFKLKLTCSLLSKVEKGTVERSLLHTRPQRSPYSHPMLEPAFFFSSLFSLLVVGCKAAPPRAAVQNVVLAMSYR